MSEPVTFGALFAEPSRNGLTRPKATRGAGTKMVNMGELFANSRLRDATMDRVPLEGGERSRFLLRSGDLLFARQSLVLSGAGKCAVFLGDTEPVTFESHVIRVRLEPMVADSLFYFYFFYSRAGRAVIESIVEQGAGASGIRATDLARVAVPHPSIESQRQIASILGALDDKIELNRRMAVTLEVMARAVFDRWFLRSEASRAWPIEPLADHVQVVRGLSYKGDGLASAGMPLHNLNSVSEGGGYKPDGIKWYVGQYAERHVVEPGDVIVTNTEQGHDRLLIGHAALVPRSFGDCGLFSHHLYRVRPKPGSVLLRSFVAYLLNSATMHDLISGYSNGTTVQMLPAEALQRPAIPIPPTSLIERFDAIATLVHERQEVLRGESRSLANLRDALLPRLLSGSIEVTE